MNYWVIQVLRGNYYAYCYRSYKAAENRYEKVKGGEAHLWPSLESDPQKAVDEFKSQMMSRK